MRYQNNNIKNEKKTSQYKGVIWKKEIEKWEVLIYLKGQKNKYGGYFKDELDAGKRVNQLCETLGIPLQNPTISALPNQKYEKRKKVSQYNGVAWHKQSRKWVVLLCSKGHKRKYGGTFNDELEAANRVNQLCEEMGIPLQNPAILNQQCQKREKISQFKGVYWNKQSKKWYVLICPKGQKRKYGGTFNDELDAGKRVNQICEELGISSQNPTLSAIINQQCYKKTKTSQYKGVTWHRRSGKWYVLVDLKEGKTKYGGYFKNELDAGKRVNQLCTSFGIPLQNPTINAIPEKKYQAREKTSQFKGVSYDRQTDKWNALVYLKIKKQKYGGQFKHEIDAAKRVNELCETFGIPLQNPTIREIPNQQNQKALVDNAMQAELEDLIKILDKNNDPITRSIKENLIAAINNGETNIMAEINLHTKIGESALSISAKHGFSNAVKFLILKGAEKHHFTNEHHTPLSLAVSQNHLKVVQVLLEKWITPNSHEKQYLHMSPIFNVKSREIAQLLIDNDAVTNEIYNNKNQSPLTIACQNGYLDVVEFFLDDGLDMNHLDIDNKTPLFYALTNKHQDVANLLISKGAQN